MFEVPKPIRIDVAFDDPDAVVSLVRRSGPYSSIASYLPPSATSGGAGEASPEVTSPWFRGNWGVAGRSLVEGGEAILCNDRFRAAAAELFSTADVSPSTVVVNVNAPMPPGAVHLDIPSFVGANRDRYPLRLLQAMGTSGLFEPWRVVEAGAVAWFYDGPGGSYDYWPDGLQGVMRQEAPPYFNCALVADNDRMYHRIGEVGDQHPEPATYPSTSCIVHDGTDGWSVVDGHRELARYSDAEVRISILWKAQIDPSRTSNVLPLTPASVASILGDDLVTRGVDVAAPASPLADDAWIALVHDVYYPPVG